MSTEALLTVGALFAAIYTLLPTEQRLNLQLRLHVLDYVILIAALLLIHYIKYLPVFQAMGVPSLGPWRWGFDEDKASYLVLLTASAFFLMRVSTARLSPRRIGIFQNLAESLLFAGRFPQLLFLLEENLGDLRRFIERRTIASCWLNWIKPHRTASMMGRFYDIDGRKSDTSWLLKRLPMTVRQQLSRIPRNHEARIQQAERLFERVFSSTPFIEYLAKARPYFCLEIVGVEKPFFREAFLEQYLVALLNDENSVLYEEIRQTQSTEGHGRYIINSLNPLLNFFVGDPFRAEQMNLYKPVGDAICARLTVLRRDPTTDPYRRPIADFFDAGRWRCPIFAGRCLFEYMVTEGLHRGVRWHLWLSYFEYWTEHIVRNMANLGPEVDHSREWPTPYHYLLYELFSTQQDWIGTAAEIDPALESVLVDKIDLDYGSIAKSATICLAACLRVVLEGDHIRPEFKGYLLGVVAHGYKVVAEHKRDELGRMFEHAILSGGTAWRDLGAYRLGLTQSLTHLDPNHLYMSPAADLVKMLRRVAAGLDVRGPDEGVAI